jgi:methionine--tRNA ligase beta chain
MNHPFDIQMNLTFGDLKNIVKKALTGDLELAREKTDGQALAISWVNGRLVAARNKSHTKNKGEGAMTIGQVAQQFAGRGELTNAYTYAMNDLSKAVASLSEPQRKKIFKDGTCFMNLEVIYPKNSNVIPYGQNLLVFHGTFEYDKEGEVIGQNQEAAKILAGMIKQVNKHVQDTYTIQGPPIQKLPKSQELSKLQGKYIGLINKLQKEFALKDTDGVADYHQAWWTNFVEKGAKKLDAQEKIGLVKRWAFGDKSFRINQIQDAKIKEWADKTDKQDQAKIAKENIMKFEEIFLGVGADVLSFMESVLTANPDSATKQLRAELGNAIKQIKASGNPQQIEKLKAGVIAAEGKSAAEKPVEEKVQQALKDEIVYDDFGKIDLRTGIITAAQKVPKADKLLQLEVDLGFEKRTILSGIAMHFQPEDIIGKQVVVVANLAPRKMRGIDSNGMILMAEDAAGKLHFVQPENAIAAGAKVS